MIFGGGKAGRSSMASKTQVMHSLRVQTSAKGQVIPLVGGTQRLPGRLIWYGDFLAIPQKSQPVIGGKGGGGSQSVASVQYKYQAAVAIALCENKIRTINGVWDTRGNNAQQQTAEDDVIPGSPYQIQVALGTFVSDVGVFFIEPFSTTYHDYGSDGGVEATGDNLIQLGQVASSPGPGEYSVDAAGLYTFNVADSGKDIEIRYIFNDQGEVPLSQFNLVVFRGSRGNADDGGAWGYLVTNHGAITPGHGQDLAYTSLAYVASELMDLGNSAELPNLSYEVISDLLFEGTLDCNPSDWLNFLLTSQISGVGVDPSWLGDWTQYSNYCIANDLLISPLMDSQRTAASWLDDYLKATNSALLWSEGLFKIVPFGDVSALGYNVTYTPQTSPAYDLDDSDFICGPGEEPVTVVYPSYADANNVVQVEYLDRPSSYNSEIIEDKEQAAIEMFGERVASPLQYHFICRQKVAAKVANFTNQRSIYIDNGPHYHFKLSGYKYDALEPGDLVTLTRSQMGLNKTPVRLIQGEQDEKGVTKWEAEPFPFGTATPTLYPKQPGDGFGPQFNARPGDVNPPILFEVFNRLANYAGHELMLGISGASKDWGGCHVWASDDGVTYKRVSAVTLKSRMGVTASTLTHANDPDTTNTVDVALAESLGELASGTADDADKFNTLCYIGSRSSKGVCDVDSSGNVTWVSGDKFDTGWGHCPRSVLMIQGGNVFAIDAVTDDEHMHVVSGTALTGVGFTVVGIRGELISYQAATLISPNTYRLGTRLRRGVYGSGAATLATSGWTHPSGSAFLRLDDSVVTVPYDLSLAQNVLYLKFTSYNQSGRNEQALADVATYAIVPAGFEAGMVTGEVAVKNNSFEDAAVMDIGSGAPPEWRWVAGDTDFLGVLALSYITGAGAYGGSGQSLQIEIVTAPGGAVIPHDEYQCHANEKFRITAAMKIVVGASPVEAAEVALRFYREDESLVSDSTSISTSSSSWDLQTLVVQAPDDPTVHHCRLVLLNGITVGNKAAFDALAVQRVPLTTAAPLGLETFSA